MYRLVVDVFFCFFGAAIPGAEARKIAEKAAARRAKVTTFIGFIGGAKHRVAERLLILDVRF